MTDAIDDTTTPDVTGVPEAPLSGPALRYPARPVGTRWPATDLGRAEVRDLVLAAWDVYSQSHQQASHVRGLGLLLDWLGEQPGTSWQERFVASGVDTMGAEWTTAPSEWLARTGDLSKRALDELLAALLRAIAADVVRPSFAWLLTAARNRRFAPLMGSVRDPVGFAEVRAACEAGPHLIPEATRLVSSRVAVILAAKGGGIADVTIGDFLQLLDAETALRGKNRLAVADFKVLREMGIFGPGVPTLREIRSTGPRSTEELVDRYAITCRPVRDLLVEYLDERRASLDYTTLARLAYALAGCFWADLERSNPGICSLRLSREVVGAWKQRLRTTHAKKRSPSGEMVTVEVERRSFLDILATVRAFYLDLAQWGLDDPERFGRWVVPCPISKADLSRRKTARRRKSRMDARTRERLPVLPVLVQTTNRWREDAAALLAAGREAKPGETFAAAGETLTRVESPYGNPRSVHAVDEAGKRRSLDREEEHAFWAWAIAEVLRLTGIRIEELTELSHHSLVEYKLPTTNEIVPLIQIAPSKSDAERLLVVPPELADVLEAIIVRLRGTDGKVPLVRARDRLELVWMPQSPLLFQHVIGAEHHAISVPFVRRLLDEALVRSGLEQDDGTPLHYSPHDFRRIFFTDVLRSGLPPHIAQVVAGHQKIETTMGYKAIYPDDAIQAHLAFLARRRALRPSEEYRTPTEQEWQQFVGSFERRKVSIGTCARAFGTPCVHEHACVRCSMLWPDPAQRGRLVEIRDSLVARIDEARREGWLGEVEGLALSLAGAESKLADVDARGDRSVPIELRSGTRRSGT